MVTSTNTTRWLFVGDSITALTTGTSGNWPGRPNSFIDQAQTKSISFTPAPAQTVVPSRLGQTAPASYSPLTQRGRIQLFSVYGVGGRTVSGLAADLQASIYIFKPDIIGLMIGTNDFPATDVTQGGAFQTSYFQIIDGVIANVPNCQKIFCMTPSIRSEAWTAAGPHLADGFDSWLGHARIQECALARPSVCEFVDVLTPMFALTRIMQPVAGTSQAQYIQTKDSLHPTPLGCQVISATLMNRVIWS